MADLFETLTLSWDGEEYEIMPTLELIGRVENIITATELYALLGRGAMPFAKLSMAFGLILRSAGCRVKDDDIFRGIFSGDDDNGAAAASVTALLAMMNPKQDNSHTKKKPKSQKGLTKA